MSRINTNFLFLLFALCSFFSLAQNTYVPDDNFEQALINLGYDAGPLDDYVPTNNINTVIELDVQYLTIADLTGIEDFIALTSLNSSENQLTNLDVSQNIALIDLNCYGNELTSLGINTNTSLIYLNCSENQLTNLDVTQNIDLINLNCHDNQLTNLDVTHNIKLRNLDGSRNILSNLDVTNNINLIDFTCYGNQLTSLDVTQNINLSSLSCSGNRITNLNVTQNINLGSLYCGDNPLSNLDITQNTKLLVLGCDNNQLSNLDVTHNINLKYLVCSSNQLSDLDLTLNSTLNQFYCSNNQLISLDIRNGNNTIIVDFDTTNNPSLTCVFVDNANWSTNNWNEIVSNSKFVENSFGCGKTDITDFIIPNFFTPNNDGEHDTWIVDDITNAIQSIYIFDRFGKIITTTTPNSEGWDGYYNGISMPSSTYRYSIELNSGEFIKGPFSLIRR